jgi:hypothetical protein
MAGQNEITSQSVPIPYKGLNGGLNSTASPLTLQPNESSKLLNIDFDKFGSAQKRNGYTPINTGDALNSGAQVTGLHWFEKSDGTTKLLYVTCGDKIYTNDLTSTFTDVTGGMTITSGSLCKFQTFLNTVMMCNGVDAPIKSTGGVFTAMTLPTDITIPRWIKTFNAYTFFADSVVGGIRQPSRLNWSTINSIDTWNDADFALISMNDGQRITGLEVLGDRLVIFKDRSIWIGQFTGDVDVPFSFQKTQSHVGCVSGYSISFIDNGLAFLGEDGVYFFDGNQSFKLSNRLNETFWGNNVSKNNLCCSMYQKFKNRYWVSQFKSGRTNAEQVITYDNFNEAFSIYEGMSPSAMVMVYSSGREIPVFGDYSGYVYQCDTGSNDELFTEGVTVQDDNSLDLYDDDDLSITFDGVIPTAIESYYYTRWMDYDDLTNQKGVAQLDLYYKVNDGILTVAYSYDFEDSDTYQLNENMSSSTDVFGIAVFDTSRFAGSGGAHSRFDLTGRGRVVRFGFKNSSLDETFRIDGIGQLVHLETNQ